MPWQGPFLGVTLAAVIGAVAPAPLSATWAANLVRHVNLTSDSARGWLPSPEQERLAGQTALSFLQARDEGRAKDAYALLSEPDKRDQPFEAFAKQLESFNSISGAPREHRLVAVTWSKDPASVPAPGVYAAIDVVSRFANIDRHCGYLVLYQAPGKGDFGVMRTEETYLDNASARKMSAAVLDETWAEMSAHCPNYPGVAEPAAAPAQPLPPLAEQSGSTTGYPTVAAALADLHSRPGVVFSDQGGWTIASDEAAGVIWSFPPPGNPAYPAAVKRQIVNGPDGASLTMDVQCEASKAACDDLVRAFTDLNAQMKKDIQASH
jgi:hypothetical protein